MASGEMSHEENIRSFERYVVRLIVEVFDYDHRRPWESGTRRVIQGVGLIVGSGKLVTCAHVVARATRIELRHLNGKQPSFGQNLAIDPETDLALVEIPDPDSYITESVRFGQLPPTKSRIQVVGIESNQDRLLIMNGSVLDVSFRKYACSQREQLLLRTDVVADRGNSGAPAFQHGNLIGISFQSRPVDGADRLELIPASLVERFLISAATGHVGVPDLGVFWQQISTESLRSYLGLRDEVGVLISRVVYGSSAHGTLQENDVLFAIDDMPIDSLGKIHSNELSVCFAHVITQKCLGDIVTLDVLRAGNQLRLNVYLKGFVSLVRPPRMHPDREYFILAGFVFIPLSYSYMNADGVRGHFRYQYYYHDLLPSSDLTGVVVLSEVLPHNINRAYTGMYCVRVVSINGVTISCLLDIELAFSSPVNGYHVIKLDNHGDRSTADEHAASNGCLVVLSAEEASKATKEVLREFGIASDRTIRR